MIMMMYIYLYLFIEYYEYIVPHTQHLRIHVKSCSVQSDTSSPQCRTQMNIEYRTDTHLRVGPALNTLSLTVIGIGNRYRNYSLRMATHMSRCSIMTSFLKKWSHESLRAILGMPVAHFRRPSLPGDTTVTAG